MSSVVLPDTSAALWRANLDSCYRHEIADELVAAVDALSSRLRRAVLVRLNDAVGCGVVDPATLDCIVEAVVASEVVVGPAGRAA